MYSFHEADITSNKLQDYLTQLLRIKYSVLDICTKLKGDKHVDIKHLSHCNRHRIIKAIICRLSKAPQYKALSITLFIRIVIYSTKYCNGKGKIIIDTVPTTLARRNTKKTFILEVVAD